MTYMPPVFDEQRRRWRRTDPLVRLIVFNWAAGMTIGALLGCGMLAFDFLGLRTLMARADATVVGSILLIASFALTFGGVVAASAAMRAGQDDDDDTRGGLRSPALSFAPAPRGPR